MPPMLPVHPPMVHPMNPHPGMMMTKPPINMPIMQRPFMNVRKQDGKIDVIGKGQSIDKIKIFYCFAFQVLLIKLLDDQCLIYQIVLNIHHL